MYAPAETAEPVPRLLQYTFSNFNEKVRWALDASGSHTGGTSLMPGSPRAMRLSVRGGTIPVLELNGERIVDSTTIIAALEQRWPDRPLYPQDPEQRKRALELEEFFDEEAGHEMRRAGFVQMLSEDPDWVGDFIGTGQRPFTRRFLRTGMPLGMLYAKRRYRFYPDEAELAEEKLAEALDRIVAERQPSGYLVGDSFSVADLTAASLLYPFAWPAQFQYELPDRPPPASIVKRLADHPGVKWISEIWERHRGESAEIT